jgi:hypothetical protein
MLDHELPGSSKKNLMSGNAIDEIRRENRSLSVRLERKPTLSLVPHAYANPYTYAYNGEDAPIDVLAMPVPTKANLPATNIYIKRKKLVMKGF